MPRLLTFIICLLLANLLLVVDLHAAVSPAVNNKKSGRPAATVTIDEIMRLAGDGVAVELGPDKSFAIFAEERIGSPQGGVILLHDHGAHPNSAGVISPLRDRLPEFGWATLSVQLPVSTAATTEQRDSLQQVALSRIGAGVEHLSNRGIRNIVLIGHGSGAVLAAEFLAADNTPSEAQGFIGISMAAATTPENRLLQFIENIRVPILDLYG